MIITLDNVPFTVEYGVDDDLLYLSSAIIHGYELIDFLNNETLEKIEVLLEKQIKEDNEESRWENAIDDWEASHD